MCSNQLIH